MECPVSVDWQSTDCESQILMVLSTLPLAICFPSGLHATEKTLKLREVRRRINRNRETKTGENLLARVSGQRRLAISRLRVPNLDGHVIATAGNLLSVGAQRHRPNTVIARNQYTNQQKKEVKNGKKTYFSECPNSIDWQSPDCESQILMVLSSLQLAMCFPSGLHATDLTLKL